jgi:transcriptional regulatory protein LEU3
MEREMEDLRRSVESQEHEKRKIVSGSLLDLSSSAVSGTSRTSEYPAPTFIPKSYTPAPDMQTANFSDASLVCEPKMLEGLTIGSEAIRDLFLEFVHKYHPFLPVVDVTRGPEEIHRLCPSLFWTIMAVASRRYDKDKELMMKLAPLLKSCLSDITISPITRYGGGGDKPNFNLASVYSVQAFLIYTFWSPLTSSMVADSSWSSAGIALFNAVRVGLHCPGYAREFGRVKADNPNYPKISEQIRTWTCCNIVSQTVGTVFGFPSFTSFDASVVSACHHDSEMDIPEQIRQMMSIQHLEHEVEKTLNSNLQDPLGLSELSERLSLIQIMARKLDTLELNIGPLDDIRRFGLLAARVHLMTYYMLDREGISTLQQQKGIIQAYNSSLDLIDHAYKASQRNRNFIKYMPGCYVQTLWQCSATITRVYHSEYAEFVDTTAGKEIFTNCVKLISRASILKHDMAYRATEIMQQLWQIYSSLHRRKKATLKLSVRTRMAASIFFDSVWSMREECGGIRSVAPTVLNQRNNPIEEDEDSNGSRNGSMRPKLESSSSNNATATHVTGPSSQQQSNTPLGAYPQPQQPPVLPSSGYLQYNAMASTAGPPTPALSATRPVIPNPNPVAPPPVPVSAGNTSNETSPENFENIFDWDADMVWRDVDLMMADFGFHAEEVAPL